MIKIITKLIIILTIFFSVFSLVYAVDDYAVLAPLPGTYTTTNGTSTTNLTTYIPNMFRLVMGIAGVLAFIMITYGGFIYATSDAIQEKGEGRGYIENAVYGLILVLGAVVLLNTINPKIMNFDILLPKPDIAGTQNTTPCANCGSLSSFGIPAKSDSLNAQADINLARKLNKLTSILDTGVDWKISEGYPPTVQHKDPCHSNGTCVDIVLTNPTANNINTFSNEANKDGLSFQYEVKTKAEKDLLVKNGVRAPLIVVNPDTNGQHFHAK